MSDPYPIPTAVYDRSSVDKDVAKDYCKIDQAYTDQDAEITATLNAVKRDVDKTLWNYFTVDDYPGSTPVDIPEDVDLFIKRRFARLFDWRTERQERESTDKLGSASIKSTPVEQSQDVDDYEPILYLRDPLGLVGF